MSHFFGQGQLARASALSLDYHLHLQLLDGLLYRL